MSLETGITGIPGLIEVALVAATGFIGWRIGAAKDAVRIYYQKEQLEKLQTEVSELRREMHGEARASASSLAHINSSLSSTAQVLERLEERIAKVEDFQRGQ